MLGRVGGDFGRMGLVRPAGHLAGASLDLNFVASSGYPAAPSLLLTTTRASDGYSRNAAGVYSLFTSNVPRITDLGLLTEAARTNLFLNSGVPATQSITVVAASVYTVSVVGTGSVTLSDAGTGTASQGSPVTFTAGSTSLTCTTAGITGAFPNVNVELGAFATSPIRTTSAAATRAADAITVNNLSSWFNASEGTFYADVAIPPSGSVNREIISVSDNTSAERFILGTGAGNTVFNPFVIDGGVVQATLTGGALADPLKVAMAYRVNDFAQSQNGGTVVTDASGTLPTADRMYLGASATGVVLGITRLRRVAYFPARLTNAQLQAITAP